MLIFSTEILTYVLCVIHIYHDIFYRMMYHITNYWGVWTTKNCLVIEDCNVPSHSHSILSVTNVRRLIKITVVRNFTRYFITFSVQSRHVSAIYWPSSGDFLTIPNIKNWSHYLCKGSVARSNCVYYRQRLPLSKFCVNIYILVFKWLLKVKIKYKILTVKILKYTGVRSMYGGCVGAYYIFRVQCKEEVTLSSYRLFRCRRVDVPVCQIINKTSLDHSRCQTCSLLHTHSLHPHKRCWNSCLKMAQTSKLKHKRWSPLWVVWFSRSFKPSVDPIEFLFQWAVGIRFW
jgi:hypothetical protein